MPSPEASRRNITFASRARRRQIRARAADAMRQPGQIRPVLASLLRGANEHVADCEYIEQDESIIRDTLKRLTYAKRVDRSPQVASWALEEIDFRLNHLEELSKGQVQALHRIERWAELDLLVSEEFTGPDRTPSLEEMWG